MNAVSIRLVEPTDAAALATAWSTHWAFLAPWSPNRRETNFSEAGRSGEISHRLAEYGAGRMVPFVIVDDDVDGAPVVGELTLSDIVRGAFQNAHIGYWLAETATGKGLATRAVADALRHAFGELGLHRVQAATLLTNQASQAVLARNGFEQIGLAPRYLQINGAWRDHLLFQRLASDAG